MKKFAVALTLVAAMLFGLSGLANAYPPEGESVTISSSSVAPGSVLTVTVDCIPGETVEVALGDEAESGSCTASAPSVAGFRGAALSAAGDPAAGSVSIGITTPTAPGTYTGTVTGSESGLIGTFTVVVEGSADPDADTGDATGGALPSTGSDGTSTMTLIAGGLLVVGIGIFAVASFRRRQPVGV